MLKILAFLKKILGDYTEHSKGETYFVCPFCHNRKRKFAINLRSMKWQCWHCSERGKSLVTLARKLDLTREQITELKTLLSADDAKKYAQHNEYTSTELALPSEFSPLWKPLTTLSYRHALAYILKRGISVPEIIRYNIGYCAMGPYAGRIIVPSYNEQNVLNYFVARSYYGNNSLKYKNPPVSKDVVVFDQLVNWEMGSVILCEGVFDAMAIKWNAIPLLGKHLPPALLTKMIEKHTQSVAIMLDADAQGPATKLAEKLVGLGLDVHNVVLGSKDAGDSLLPEIWGAISNSSTHSFKDFITQKLEN